MLPLTLPKLSCRIWEMLFLRTIVAVSILLCPFLARAEGSSAQVDDLPPYPRFVLGKLYTMAARDPAGLSDGASAMPNEPLVVLGRVVKAATAGTDSDLLVDDIMACCISHSVAFRLAEGSDLEDGAWLAVYGKVIPASVPAVTGRAPWGSGSSIYVIGGFEMEVERVVPAELLMYPDNVIDVLTSDSARLFLRALKETGLDQRLRVAESITVLLPVDQAMESLPEGELEALFDPENRELLARFVLAHIIPERLLKRDLLERSVVTTLDKAVVRVEVVNGKALPGGSRILFADQIGSNGVVHMIAPALSIQQPKQPASAADIYDPLNLTAPNHPTPTPRPPGRQ